MNKILIYRTIYLVIYIAVWVLLLYSRPAGIFYDKTIAFIWIPFAAVFFLLPLILYKILRTLHILDKFAAMIAILSVFLAYPYGLILEYQEEQRFIKFGLQTKGYVYERKYHNSRRSRGWTIRAEYFIENKRYVTFAISDDEHKYNVGDCITVLYDSMNPEISKVLDR